MKKAVLFILLLGMASVTAEPTQLIWKVKTGELIEFEIYDYVSEFYPQLTDTTFTLKMTKLPNSLNENTSYFTYTNNSLSNLLFDYLQYFVVPIALTVNGSTYNLLSNFKSMVEKNSSLGIAYDESGIMSNFRIWSNESLVILELTKAVTTNKLPIVDIFPVLIIVAIWRKINLSNIQ